MQHLQTCTSGAALSKSEAPYAQKELRMSAGTSNEPWGLGVLPDETIALIAVHMSFGAFNALSRLSRRLHKLLSLQDGPCIKTFKENIERRFPREKHCELFAKLATLYPEVDFVKLLRAIGGNLAGRFVLDAITNGTAQAKAVDVFVPYTLYNNTESYTHEGLINGVLNFFSSKNIEKAILALLSEHFGDAYTVGKFVGFARNYESIYGKLVQVNYAVQVWSKRQNVPFVCFYFTAVSFRCEMSMMVRSFEASFDRSWANADVLRIHNLYEAIRRSGTYEDVNYPYRMRDTMEAMLKRREKALEQGFIVLASKEEQ